MLHTLQEDDNRAVAEIQKAAEAERKSQGRKANLATPFDVEDRIDF